MSGQFRSLRQIVESTIYSEDQNKINESSRPVSKERLLRRRRKLLSAAQNLRDAKRVHKGRILQNNRSFIRPWWDRDPQCLRQNDKLDCLQTTHSDSTCRSHLPTTDRQKCTAQNLHLICAAYDTE